MLNTGGCSLAMRSRMAERSAPEAGSSCTRPREKKKIDGNRKLVIESGCSPIAFLRDMRSSNRSRLQGSNVPRSLAASSPI